MFTAVRTSNLTNYVIINLWLLLAAAGRLKQEKERGNTNKLVIDPLSCVHREVSVISSSVFCYIMLCSPLKVNRRFGGSCCLHLQGQRNVKKEKSVNQITSIAPCWFLAWLILLLWRWKRHGLPVRQLTSNWLHDVISQKMELFIIIAVRTSSPTWFYCRFREIDSCNYNLDVSIIWHSFLQNVRQWFSIVFSLIDTSSPDLKIECTRHEYLGSLTYGCLEPRFLPYMSYRCKSTNHIDYLNVIILITVLSRTQSP
jgi:hypothetical protein